MKTKKTTTYKPLPVNFSDRTNFLIVIAVILLVNTLMYFTAFPMIENITAGGPDSAQGSFFLKATSIVATDIFLFVTLSMILSRRSARHEKR